MPADATTAPARPATPLAALVAPFVAVAAAAALAVAPSPARANDFPTYARVDYVIGCMAANGGSQVAMRRCACAVDAIAGRMPYAEYERAETALRMADPSVGTQGSVFRETPVVRRALEQLRAAQAEANLRCGA